MGKARRPHVVHPGKPGKKLLPQVLRELHRVVHRRVPADRRARARGVVDGVGRVPAGVGGQRIVVERQRGGNPGREHHRQRRGHRYERPQSGAMAPGDPGQADGRCRIQEEAVALGQRQQHQRDADPDRQAHRQSPSQCPDEQQQEDGPRGVGRGVVVHRPGDEREHRLEGHEQAGGRGRPGMAGQQLAPQQEHRRRGDRAQQGADQAHQRDARPDRGAVRRQVGGRNPCLAQRLLQLRLPVGQPRALGAEAHAQLSYPCRDLLVDGGLLLVRAPRRGQPRHFRPV